MKKVFCIGFQKTGTSSLGKALEILGYNVCGVRLDLAHDLLDNQHEKVWKITKQYDAFQDNPWGPLYYVLYTRYPDAKFILTTRDSKEWIKSVVNHFGGTNTKMRQWLYGASDPLGYEDIYEDRYKNHNKKVKSFFENKPDQLLVMKLEEGFSWEELCPFLKKTIPSSDFPYENAGVYNNKFLKAVKKIRIRLKLLTNDY